MLCAKKSEVGYPWQVNDLYMDKSLMALFLILYKPLCFISDNEAPYGRRSVIVISVPRIGPRALCIVCLHNSWQCNNIISFCMTMVSKSMRTYWKQFVSFSYFFLTTQGGSSRLCMRPGGLPVLAPPQQLPCHCVRPTHSQHLPGASAGDVAADHTDHAEGAADTSG